MAQRLLKFLPKWQDFVKSGHTSHCSTFEFTLECCCVSRRLTYFTHLNATKKENNCTSV